MAGQGGSVSTNVMWGPIQSAVAQRLSTAETWGLIQSDLTARGLAIPTGAFLAVNQLRSIAVGIREASARLNATGFLGTLDAGMIASSPFGRTLQEQALAPAWQVRFLNQLRLPDGSLETVWHTTDIYGHLPATTAELLNQVQADADYIAGSYAGSSSEGVSNLQLIAF